ncbi:O-antigen ligase family protein [Mycolicibacterium rutilum]|nr:O-antigen ligase family protein [Mycolicibacterium rutilum]
MHIAYADFIFPFLALVTFAAPATKRQLSALRPLAYFALAMLTLVACSTLVASLFDPGFNAKLAVLNTIKLVVVFAYAVVFAVYAAILTREQFLSLLRLWGWTATVVSIATVFTAVGLVQIVPFSSDGARSQGFFQDPNLYGGYLTLSLCVIVAAEVMKTSYWSILQILSVAAAVVLTASRGSMITLGLVGVLALVFVATWKVRIVVGGLGVASAALYAVGTGFSVPWLSPAIARLGEAGRSVGEDPRLRIWRRAVDIWSDQPVFGVGIGQFGRFTIDVNGYDEHDVGQIAHNTFLSFLVESGILGLVLCVGGMAFLVFRLLLDRRIEGRLRYALGLGVFAICIGMFTLNFQNVRYMWVFIGLIWGFTVWQGKAVGYPRTPPTTRKHDVDAPYTVSPGARHAAREHAGTQPIILHRDL